MDRILLTLFCCCVWVFLEVLLFHPRAGVGCGWWPPGQTFPGVMGMPCLAMLGLCRQGRSGEARPPSLTWPLTFAIIFPLVQLLWPTSHGRKGKHGEGSLAVWGEGILDSLFTSDQKSTLSCSIANAHMARKGCAWEGSKNRTSISTSVIRHVFHSHRQEVFFTWYAATLSF